MIFPKFKVLSDLQQSNYSIQLTDSYYFQRYNQSIVFLQLLCFLSTHSSANILWYFIYFIWHLWEFEGIKIIIDDRSFLRPRIIWCVAGTIWFQIIVSFIFINKFGLRTAQQKGKAQTKFFICFHDFHYFPFFADMENTWKNEYWH